jgi:hypothetical protein
VYRLVWDRLPFGVPGKLAGLAVLLVGVVAVLWFVVFPGADALLPFNNVQVTVPNESPTDYATVVPTPTERETAPAGPSTQHRAPSPTATSLPT